MILVGTAFYFFYPRQKTINYYTESDSIDFHNGDLVLRRGKSLVSQMVLLRDKHSEYSHVGVVVIKNGQPFVVHATPGEAEKDQPEYVKMETIQEFLDVEKSADFAVYSLTKQNSEIGTKVARKALDYYDQHIEFDSKFDLKDDSKLYCTELVWLAYKAAGINLIETYDEVNIPFYKGDFIYPSNLFMNPIFKRTYPN